MPRSIRNSKVEDFEPSKKNPIGLLDDSNLDSHLKSLKIGDKSTPLQISDEAIRIASDFTLDGNLLNSRIGTEKTYLELYAGQYVTIDTDGLTNKSNKVSIGYIYTSVFLVNTNESSQMYNTGNGYIELNAGGDDIRLKAAAAVQIFDTTKLIFGSDFSTTAGELDTYIQESSADVLDIYVGGLNILKLDEVNDKVEVGGAHLEIDATKKLYLDGGGNTYIEESSADVLDIKVGGDMIFQITESGADGNTIDINSACIGFTQREPLYDASNTVIDFRHSNKQFVTFGSGNITNITLTFPLVSGNFVLLLKQDGTGSRTVTNWKAAEFDESAADGAASVKFAGGSNPTLTTDANHVDIISFYWDADNEIAYGVATLDFQF